VLGSFLGYPCLLDFTFFVGGNQGVSGWVAGVGETGFLWGFRIICKYLGEKPGFWVSGWGWRNRVFMGI